jgi:hypothetical protein
LQLDHPAHLGTFKFKPFVADEVWYSTQPGTTGRQGWFRNRISAGIIKQFGERFNAEFFYLYQHDGVSRPGNVHADSNNDRNNQSYPLALHRRLS